MALFQEIQAMASTKILSVIRILNLTLYKRSYWSFRMKSSRLFTVVPHMVERVGFLHSFHYFADFINSEGIKELYFVVSFLTWKKKSYVCRRNGILRLVLNTTSRNILGNGQSLTAIKTLDMSNTTQI